MFFQSNIGNCIKCNACTMACPVVSIEGISVFSGPRNLCVDTARYGNAAAILPSDVYRCTTCWKCEELCPQSLPLAETILELRKSIFDFNVLSDGHKKIIENIDKYGRSIVPITQERKKYKVKKAPLLYFPGCISEMRITSIFDSTIRLLERSGVKFGIPDEWVCCGAPLEKLGDSERLEFLRDRNLDYFDGFEDIVTSCPGCATHFLKYYDKDPLHTIEIVWEMMRKRKLVFKSRKKGLRVALHHPCHLNRTIGPQIIDQAYDILQCVEGIEIIDLDKPDACCGGGGAVVAGFPELALKLATEKMLDALHHDVGLLLAPCPFCVLNLRRPGIGKVEDFATFIERNLACKKEGDKKK
ncbi:MAG: (Fe-S)-binding protein [Methanomassiliicoccales archaeon]